MAQVSISLDADLAIELMLMTGTKSPQDAVQLVALDFLARGRRTEARTGDARDAHRTAEPHPNHSEQG
ncbi:hypothetical protein [Yinghuangia sp. YIM S09857]|uniref:hypothetical protein n=1 Tax=Yinghuangia sp. YIM S09857 TaxID=3436929 RepID=UPI003F52E8C2